MQKSDKAPKRSSLGDLPQPTNRADNRNIVSLWQWAGDEDKTHLRTVAAAVVETVHAPPAMTFRQALHFQIPTA